MTATFADHGIQIPPGRGGEIDTLCPECSHTRKKSRDKCLSVNTDSGVWLCNHCGWKGGLGGERDWRDAVPPKPTYTIPAPPNDTILPQGVLDWFAARGIPDWVLADTGITAGKEFCPALSKEALTVRFPYLRDGALVNIKYRAQPKHFWMAKGAERILYGLDGIAGEETICIVEGEMDKLSIDAVQGPATVSVPDGAPAPDASNYARKFAFLEGIAEQRFAAAKQVILATDMDAPGQKLADELARRIGYRKCTRVTWPDGCKDANETLVTCGPSAVLTALTDAQPFPVAGIVTVRELAGPLEALYERGLDRGCDAGWRTFDRHYRARHGLLTIVTGSPGSGKSFFLDNLMVRLAERHGWRFAVCSPENQPFERHLATILSIQQRAPFADGPLPRMTPGMRDDARRWAEGHFTFVLPDEPTVAAVLDRADVLVYRQGIRGLVIDPWNELDHTRPNGMTETEFVSQSLTRLRNWARVAGVQVWLVAHPTKLHKADDGSYPVPTPYDISGCYSDDTDVLTRTGWKRHEALEDDEVLCFDMENHTTRWEKPTATWAYQYDGEMCHFRGRNLDMLVTPNHRMVVKPQWTHPGRNPEHWRSLDRSWQFVQADALSGSPWLVPFAAPLGADSDDRAVMVLDDGYAMDDFLRFLGWYIAEGCIQMGSPSICQGVGPLADEMSATLARLRLDVREAVGNPGTGGSVRGWKARVRARVHPELSRWFVEEFPQGAAIKHIPRFVWDLSQRQKRILLDALLQGDGSEGNGLQQGTWKYTTTSPRLADDVQRLVLELGRSAKVGRRPGRKPHHADQYTVYIGREGYRERDLVLRRHLARVPYSGKVWCLTVPTGAYVTRRNGCVSFQGNSAHFANKADACLSVWRNALGNEPEIHVQKIRFAETGQLGMVPFRFDKATGRFEER